jgi:PKD repeat protein
VIVVRRVLLGRLLLLGLCVGVLSFAGCNWIWPQPAVDFGLDPSSGSKPLLVDFTPIVEGEPTAYLWDFGDGSTSSEQAPSHVYYTAGTYSVTLTVSYVTGAVVTVEKTDCVEVRKGLASGAVPKLYWLDSSGSGAIRYGALAGGPVTTLFTGIFYGQSLTVGLDRIYWVDGPHIDKGWTDGTYRFSLVYFYGEPRGICLDAANSKLYWTGLPNYYGNGGILRCDTSGNNQETWAQEWGGGDGDAVPWFLAVDSASGRLYYFRMYYRYEPVHPRAASEVKADPISASIEWTSTETFASHPVIGNLSRSGGMAIDAGLSAGARYIYWTNPEGGRIERCKIDGTEHTSLITGLDSPQGIAVDIRGGKLYWSDTAGIHRANLDGTGQELIYPGANADALALG